jgi:pyruvate formate lyase-like protein
VEKESRINRIYDRTVFTVPTLSIQRAKYFTEKWKSLNPGIHQKLRIIKSINHAFEKMDFYIDQDDRLVGNWTELPAGIPLKIEQQELSFTYLIKKRWLPSKIQKLASFQLSQKGKSGVSKEGMLIPHQIQSRDRSDFKKNLLPFWVEKSNYNPPEGGIKPESASTQMESATASDNTAQFMGISFDPQLSPLVPDYESVIKQGLLPLLGKVRRASDQAAESSGGGTVDLECLELSIMGIIVFSRRLVRNVERFPGFESVAVRKRILDACHRVPLYPARNFHEAIQSYWIFKTAIELADPSELKSPGKLDQIFYPFYKDDLRSGKMNKDEADELLQELFIKLMCHQITPCSKRTKGFKLRYDSSNPIILGGVNHNGTCAINPLTYLILDSAVQSKSALRFDLQVNEDVPDKILKKVRNLQAGGAGNLLVTNSGESAGK